MNAFTFPKASLSPSISGTDGSVSSPLGVRKAGVVSDSSTGCGDDSKFLLSAQIDSFVRAEKEFALIWKFGGSPRWFRDEQVGVSNSFFWTRSFSGSAGTGAWLGWPANNKLVEVSPPAGVGAAPLEAPFQIDSTCDVESKADWSKRVRAAQKQISTGAINKIVLSRTRAGRISSGSLGAALLSIGEPSQGQTLFLWHRPGSGSFMGMSPETLFSLQDGNICVDALAGTSQEAESLLASDKDIHEHRVVCDDLRTPLEQLAENLSESSRDAVQRGSLFHLLTRFHGQIGPERELDALVDALHPTAAVGVSPKSASDIFKKLELADRGYYAAPFGVIEMEGSKNQLKQADISVALRCALLRDETVTFFGGCGIVAESNPHDEWAETHEKMASIEKNWSSQ